jgi:NADH-quinone oxidoreductase subunit C
MKQEINWQKLEVPLEFKLVNIEKIKEDYPILISITAVDNPNKELRFTLIYNFLSIEKQSRLELKVPLSSSCLAASIEKYYPNSNWYEREIWDLFGIPFQNHPDLRRIMTDYGFIGHPLRKDFPVHGYQEVTFTEGAVNYIALNLPQDFRSFDIRSGWQGPLPGDEKASN